ncbi:MAG: accessory gene regulator ArgB-like protein [Anaeroplasma sp.]
MINQLATLLTNHYIKKGKIDPDDKEVYVYCFDIAISTVLNFAILIIIALCTKTYIESLCFGICFVTLRNYAGGLHAKTHLGCSILLIVVILVWVATINYVEVEYLKPMSYIFVVISAPVILLLAPVDNANNVLDANQTKKYKIKTLIVIFISLIGYLILFLLNKYTYSFVISYAIICVCISMIVQKSINKMNNKK